MQIMTKKISNISVNFLFFFFLSVSAHFSQISKPLEILGISVEGNKSADPTTIIANSGLRVGDELVPFSDATQKAIERLWALNIFEDIQIEIEKKIENGVFLVIKVTEYPRVEKIGFRGLDHFDEDDIEDKVVLKRAGQIIKPQDIFEIRNEIKKLYEEDGYLNVKMTPIKFYFDSADTTDDEITIIWKNIENINDKYETTQEFNQQSSFDVLSRIKDRVVYVFDVEEGDEVVVRRISFEGNEAFDDDEIRGVMDKVSEARWWKFWASSNLDKEGFKEDKKLIEDFYKKNGYRDARIIEDSLKFYNDNKDVEVYVKMFEGPQYKVRNIIWKGNTVYGDEELSARLGFKTGDIYNLEKFNQNLRFNEAQTDVSSLYQDNGYLTFNVTPNEIIVGEDSLDIELTVQENSRFKIGEVNISGNSKTKEKVIRRELYTIPGDFFSRNAIFRSIQQLANLQYFNVEHLYSKGVDYRPASDSTVNLIYSVQEKSSDYLNASVGYSGSFGFSGAIGVTLTNFSITEPFQLGGGQVLNFNWQFGVANFYRTFTLGFTEPWFLDTPTLVGFDVFDTRQRYVYDLRQSGGTIKVGRRLKWPDNYFYVQGLLRFQYNDVIEGQDFYEEGISRQYTLGTVISRTDIDNPIFPTIGSKISMSVEVSGGPALPGDVDYYKIEFKADYYRRLFNSNRVAFYTGLDIGYIDEFSFGTPIQPFEFFYMGGNGLIIATTPLRGYEDRSVGPKSSSGRIVGGRVMTKYTMELRAALALEPIPIYILGFAEAGNSFLSLRESDIFDLKRSIGIGARLLLNPIGLIGFDYGYGFDRQTVDGQEPSWIFHFQFGKGF